MQPSVLLRASALDKVMLHRQRNSIKVAENRETCEETTPYTRYRFQEFTATPRNMACATYRPQAICMQLATFTADDSSTMQLGMAFDG
jgi:hypothetical protein